MKLFLYPEFAGEDQGDGGVRRVVEAQRKSLPRHRVTLVDDPGDASVIAAHIMQPEQWLNRFVDKPLVIHCHGLYWSEYEWPEWAYKANRRVLQAICSADAVTAPTEWVARVIERHTSRRVDVIPHGISMRDWQPPSAPGDYVLWNKTRIDPVCEVDTVNALISLLPRVRFVSTFAEPAPNVTVTGRLPFKEAKQKVRGAGVYLCTTRETFGIGTLEAMACGVPIVGYRFGGQAEYIEHGVDGWLAEPGDIRGLAEGINWAFKNRETAGKAAREKAGQFSWTAAAGMYADLYRRVEAQYEAQQKAPRVSIVVPAYNLAQYLPDTLQSIQEQTDRDWECIIVDDASPDDCGKIADEWAEKDPRFRVIHNAENLYLAESRNVAIEQARGRYILPVDADDMITSSTVGMLADALDADRSLACAYGNVLFVDEDGHTPTDYRVSGHSPGHSGWPMRMDPWMQTGGANLQPYCSMFRRSMWEQLGGYRRRLKTAEDADFWTRAASWGFRSELVVTTDTLIYRNRAGSMSRANDGKRYDYLRWFPWSKDQTLAPAGLAGDKAVNLLEPKVSVVIPVGPGHGRYVQDAIDSVMAQSYPFWECIVVNDSGEPLFLPPWVRVIDSDVRDPGAARNLGIAQAKAQLYLPLDADDFLQPDALQWLLSAHVQTDGAIVYPDFYEDPGTPGDYKHYRLADFSCTHLTTRGTVHSVTALTPVRAWREVGGYAEHMQWEDWDFQLRCAAAGICSVRLAAPLFTYRKHTGRRRDWRDGDEFEERKQAILERWRPYFTGEKEFMACGCKAKTISPSNNQAAAQQSAQQQYGDAVMIEYTGAKAGSVRYRGTTGTIYTFAANDGPRYVDAKDLPIFVARPDFRVLADTSVSSTGSPTDPVLIA